MHQPLPLGGCGMRRPVTAHACAPSVQTESGQQGLPKIHWNPKQLIRFRRAGATLVIVAMLLTFFVGILSLSVDLGYVRLTHAQMQNSADAAALAAAQDLPSNELVMATPDYGAIHSLARNTAVQFAAANYVENQPPLVDSNPSNAPTGDVMIGYLADPTDPDAPLDYSNMAQFNVVQVRIRKSTAINGPVTAFFSRALGNQGTPLTAQATALISSDIVGFKVTEESGNSDLLPFVIDIDDWNAMLAGQGSDNYAYDDTTGQVTAGADGVLEIKLYPLSNNSNGSGAVPGNFGTVDIGSPDNSTQDLSRQISEGVSAADLAYFGGTLQLGPDGTLQLNGDTGVSAAIKDELEAIKGKPRTICLYQTVAEQGNEATYTIVGFAGVQIVEVAINGALSEKHVTVQPAVVVDHTAVIGVGANQSIFVYSNVRLVR